MPQVAPACLQAHSRRAWVTSAACTRAPAAMARAGRLQNRCSPPASAAAGRAPASSRPGRANVVKMTTPSGEAAFFSTEACVSFVTSLRQSGGRGKPVATAGASCRRPALPVLTLLMPAAVRRLAADVSSSLAFDSAHPSARSAANNRSGRHIARVLPSLGESVCVLQGRAQGVSSPRGVQNHNKWRAAGRCRRSIPGITAAPLPAVPHHHQCRCAPPRHRAAAILCSAGNTGWRTEGCKA